MKRRGFLLIIMLLFVPFVVNTIAQAPTTTDVAVYQLGLLTETLPGLDMNYTITVTNHGPAEVTTFYILDGWTVNDEGLSGFVEPIAEPDFGEFEVVGSWQRNEKDQIIVAWLLQGTLDPGKTEQFDWRVTVDMAYQGALVNWASINTDGVLGADWQPRIATVMPQPPGISNVEEANLENNRTSDGITIVTNDPTGEGLDLAVYQTGTLTQTQVNAPLLSEWLVANLGPQPVKQFYIMAGWSLAGEGAGVFTLPIAEPDFGDFQVLGSWRQSGLDEERWLWLIEGELLAGSSASFVWLRRLAPAFSGDLINRVEISVLTPPAGEWLPRADTQIAPPVLPNTADNVPENDRTVDALTTIHP